jgi:phosphonoacetate hydrolase
LGSFAIVYGDPGYKAGSASGIVAVAPRAAAAERFELPLDRIGDLAVVARSDL